MVSTRKPGFLNKTAIVGVGYTELSRDSGRGVLELAAEACRNAVEDAGIALSDVNGIASFRFLEDSCPTQSVATALGLPDSTYLLDMNLGGQAPCYLVAHAAMAINAGLADHVLVYRALNGRSGQRVGTARLPGPATAFRYPLGLTAYSQVIALWGRRFMNATGATPEDLAAVPIASRVWSRDNPRAIRKKALTLDEYFSTPMLADPFRPQDCTAEVDGACAVLVSSLDAARDMKQTPAIISSAAFSAGRRPGLDMGDTLVWEDQSYNYTTYLRDRLWGYAGMSPSDVDFAEIYDCFSTTTLFGLEGLGLVPRGESGAFIRAGHTGPGGSLPVNTNGGLLSEGYLHGMNTIAEAVLQLQGRCGVRNVPDANSCVVTSGALQDGSALILTKG